MGDASTRVGTTWTAKAPLVRSAPLTNRAALGLERRGDFRNLQNDAGAPALTDGKPLSTREPVQDQDETTLEEVRVREALGRMGAPPRRPGGHDGSTAPQPRQQRRFVREGEVQVETVGNRARHGGASAEAAALARRLREAEAALQIERIERERVGRLLEQALETRRQLEVRLRHEADARDEAEKALAALRAAGVDAECLRAQLQAAQELLEATRSAEAAARQAVRSTKAALTRERTALAAEREAHATTAAELQTALLTLAATKRELAAVRRELAEAVAQARPTSRRQVPKAEKLETRKAPARTSPSPAKGPGLLGAAKSTSRKPAATTPKTTTAAQRSRSKGAKAATPKSSPPVRTTGGRGSVTRRVSTTETGRKTPAKRR